jgi:hypothetical protein
MAKFLNDELKQRIYTRIADLIKDMEDGLNLNEDLSNNQDSISSGTNPTSIAEKIKEKEAAKRGKQVMNQEEESDEEYFEKFSKKFQRWSEFKKNGEEITKGMTIWEELDNFSEGNSEGEKEVKLSSISEPEVQIEPEAKAESKHVSYDSMNQVYSQFPKTELIKLLNASSHKYRKLKVNC